QQLKAAGLYPTVDAPEYNQFGGSVPMGFNVVVTAPAGTIYYTTDGSDPRLIGGAVNGTAQSGASGLTVLINATTQVKARARNGTTWSAITDATFTAIAPTSTPTPSPTPSPSPSATATASPTLSPTPTATPTATPSPSPFPTQDPDVGDAWVVS
ncbi:MAG TPA: chitobiase/beta-hexosaminidase C-terminal domain-containing protein, partial [Candidatus Sumerlaeota bacterium]|nr:chitobiase/beta-hexosaminidase C-terminal domain-containing protein [Candidatus Sumerlaeota bacterium]